MTVQIFGKNKCFDTKKAQRFFKERGIKVQYINLMQKGFSHGEYLSVKQAVGGIDSLIDKSHPDASLVNYLEREDDRDEQLLSQPSMIRTPVVRYGKKATVGCCPDIWEEWVKEEKKQ